MGERDGMSVQMNNTSHAAGQIYFNRTVHDVIAPLYESHHPEIFNPTEQSRIRGILKKLLAESGSAGGRPYILDYGAGTGNLTKQLLELGASVVAAEVSKGCLDELLSCVGSREKCETLLVNGHDLREINSCTFDLVATYSVLHHVPDYLTIVDELVRVLRPGGILYIDHEVCPAYWDNDPAYLEYCCELKRQTVEGPGPVARLGALLARKGWWRYLLALLRFRLQGNADEGDIHVHRDDHVDWSAIRRRIEPWCEVVKEEDYLICREQPFPAPVWEKWRNRCADMRLLVAQKR